MKRLLYLLLFVCSLVGAQETQLALSNTIFHRPHWVFTQNQTSFVLNLNDLGAGAVNTTPQFSLGSSTATFIRATTAWTKLSTGLWAAVGTGVARSYYLGADSAVGVYGGYIAEGVRTNQALQARDLSTTWTALNATLVKDQVGIDGVASSASSMTATAINGSALQTITEAATLSALSMFIKRITGTGTVTIQQGVSTLEVSASIKSSTYTRIELDATVLNPAIGIVLGTNGDAIAVDMVQFENGSFASSPIPTTTIAVARNADVLRYASAGNALNSNGSIYLEYTPVQTSLGASLVQIDDGSANNRYVVYQNVTTPDAFVNTASVIQADVIAGTLTVGSTSKVAGSFITNNVNAFNNGIAGTADTSVTMPSGLTTIRIGNMSNSLNQPYGSIKNVSIYPVELSAARLQAMTTP